MGWLCGCMAPSRCFGVVVRLVSVGLDQYGACEIERRPRASRAALAPVCFRPVWPVTRARPPCSYGAVSCHAPRGARKSPGITGPKQRRSERSSRCAAGGARSPGAAKHRRQAGSHICFGPGCPGPAHATGCEFLGVVVRLVSVGLDQCGACEIERRPRRIASCARSLYVVTGLAGELFSSG